MLPRSELWEAATWSQDILEDLVVANGIGLEQQDPKSRKKQRVKKEAGEDKGRETAQDIYRDP